MSSDPAAKGPRRNIRIGKYEVLSHVATGGMGAVYRAKDSENGREVALKVLSPEMAAKPAMLERFRREAKHASKLRHENVVTLYEFGEANRTFFLAMEFIDGIDLHEYSNRKGALDPDEALQIIVQACRALDHAYRRGIIHRDIKPSNFLVTQQGERMVVKMTDLGLAREASNEEFRVTRAGTTVGTLDYMAPEQARDSGLADIRSDVYSLGSTWYHLLAGHPPFPKGGLGERLNRILNEEPPSIRRFNPRVSEPMAGVLQQMMAKRPAQRYQTPEELLRDLEALARGEPPLSLHDLLENLGQEEAGSAAAPSRSIKKSRRGDGRRTPRSLRSHSQPDTDAGKSSAERPAAKRARSSPPHLWYGLAGLTAIILVVGLSVLFSLRRSHKEESLTEDSSAIPSGPAVSTPIVALPAPNPKPDKGGIAAKPIVAPPKKPNWPALYQPSKPIDVAALLKEVEAPWSTPAATGPTVELVVGRLPPDKSGKTFRSLADACKAVPLGATGVIELRDNGPFFGSSAAVADRSLILRAAKGYRPLLIWDVQQTLDERRRGSLGVSRTASGDGPLIFLDVKHGNLTLQNVHVAFKWPEAASEGAALLRVEDGDLTVEDCTFSAAGKPRDGVTLARFAAARPESGRCRFSRCQARGAGLSMLDVNAPGGQVLFDDCLLVGGDAPLLQVRAAADRPTNVRAVRSTMVCGKNLLTVRPAKEGGREAAFQWLGWDVLLARKTREAGGELLRLSGDLNTQRMNWRAINCLYAGWETLLAGPSTIPATDVSAWRHLWSRFEGDVVQADAWPSAVVPEPAEAPASTYRTADSAVAFAASTGSDRLLGCDPARLPSARDNWLSLTFDRFAIVPPSLPEDAEPPEIPIPSDGLYHGERLDLNRVDLGAYLQAVQKTRRLAPRVVLHLAGNGERFTTPIRFKGSSLVLYFEPPPEKPAPPAEKAEPLALIPAGQGSEKALIEVEQGSLDVINGRLRLSDAAEARVLPWLIKVSGGDVRLYRSRLEVPPKSKGAAFRSLISLDGSGNAAAERVRSCAVNESVLLSARGGLHLQGIGVRVLLAQTLLIAGDDAVHLALDPGFAGKSNVQCLLERATVVARGSVVHVRQVQRTQPPIEPAVVQTHECVFVNPFRGSRPALVYYEGEALSRGLLVWQSDTDAFDRRLWFAAACDKGPLPDKASNHATWPALWGTPSLRHALLDLPLFSTFSADRWLVERLIGMKIPGKGADLEKLGVTLNPMKKVPR